MLIRCCPQCKGDGFYRVKKENTYPEMNIAGARLIRKTNGAVASLAAYYDSIVGYEFDCHRCHSSGEMVWNRGKSLIPILRT